MRFCSFVFVGWPIDCSLIFKNPSLKVLRPGRTFWEPPQLVFYHLLEKKGCGDSLSLYLKFSTFRTILQQSAAGIFTFHNIFSNNFCFCRRLHKNCKKIVSDWLYCFYNTANSILVVWTWLRSQFHLNESPRRIFYTKKRLDCGNDFRKIGYVCETLRQRFLNFKEQSNWYSYCLNCNNLTPFELNKYSSIN